MQLSAAQDAFAVRLYDWSARDLTREMDEDFPLLSSVGLNNYTIAAFVSWVRTMRVDQRGALAAALIRRIHEHAAALRGEALTREERDWWNNEFYNNVTLHKDSLPPFSSLDETLPSFRPVDPDACLDTLVQSVTPVLGNISRRKSSVSAWRRIADWKLITEFTFSRRERDLRFEYQFVRKDGARVIGHGGPYPRNLFMMYGVWTETSVEVPSQADSEPMARAIAKLAEHFAGQAGPLFAGLGIGD
jgi:hypothetical protein